MAYDLEEQEQIATFKAFWGRYGNLITWVLILALGSFAAYNFWNSHSRKQAVEASALYDEQTDALTAKDNAKSQRIASDIQSKFKRTVYAQMSALTAAKTAFEANDLKTAKTQLQWVIDNGNDEYKSVAQLRLAGVLLDEKNFDGALKLLDGKFLPQFAAEVADRKGDVLVAQNKIADARAAYVAALAAMGPKHPGSQLVRIKLEAIGGTAPAAAAAPKAAA
ncbi:YfgM family protein [Massilia litorea]|jgi:predicted negative regulator of RcsB-dependent stress response|uniref:Ancillary SecYEG translocon subunit n=1 Tax=Massilia litorea TaxID=2769491 RepID=A0A7L9U128_9BURK|nr:tetratricopeptide repeat protein [Massilia litorea]QOL47895.1 tetratricopeptide repeat protein [Massilia litorea]